MVAVIKGEMSREQQSELLHNVAADAENEQEDLEHPHPKNKSPQDNEQERLDQADELDNDAMHIENMSFSVKDIRSYTNLASKKSDKTYQEVAPSHTQDHDTVFEFVPRKE